MRRAATGVLAMALLSAFGVLANTPTVPVAAVRTASVGATADRFTMSSATVDETGLSFAGLVDVVAGSTTTPTMKFTLAGATMHGFDLSIDCTSSFTLRSSVADPATAVAGATTLYLTSFTFTLSGTPQTFTVDQPPIVGYALPSETLTGVEMVGVRADVASMTLHHLTQKPVAC